MGFNEDKHILTEYSSVWSLKSPVEHVNPILIPSSNVCCNFVLKIAWFVVLPFRYLAQSRLLIMVTLASTSSPVSPDCSVKIENVFRCFPRTFTTLRSKSNYKHNCYLVLCTHSLVQYLFFHLLNF